MSIQSAAPAAQQTSRSSAKGAPAINVRAKTAKRTPELEARLGARIRTARVAAHMSQGALGETIGVSFQQLQKYELGKDRVAVSTLQSIAAALGVHPGLFFDDSVPVPVGSLPDVRAAMRVAEAVQRVRDPAVLKCLVALVEALADSAGR